MSPSQSKDCAFCSNSSRRSSVAIKGVRDAADLSSCAKNRAGRNHPSDFAYLWIRWRMIASASIQNSMPFHVVVLTAPQVVASNVLPARKDVRTSAGVGQCPPITALAATSPTRTSIAKRWAELIRRHDACSAPRPILPDTASGLRRPIASSVDLSVWKSLVVMPGRATIFSAPGMNVLVGDQQAIPTLQFVRFLEGPLAQHIESGSGVFQAVSTQAHRIVASRIRRILHNGFDPKSSDASVTIRRMRSSIVGREASIRTSASLKTCSRCGGDVVVGRQPIRRPYD